MCCEHERILPDAVSMVIILPMYVVHSVDGEVSVCVMGWLKVGDAACGDAQASHHCEGTHDTLERLESHHPSVCPLFCVKLVCVNCRHSWTSHVTMQSKIQDDFQMRVWFSMCVYVCVCFYIELFLWPVQATAANTQHWPYFTPDFDLLHFSRMGTLLIHLVGCTPPV